MIELGEGDFEVVEDDGAPDGVPGEDGGAAAGGARGIVGRMHPPIVHFAVAWAVLLLPFGIARLKNDRLGRIDLWLVASSTAAAGAAVVTGLAHEADVASRPGVHELVERHEAAGIAALVMLALALAARILMERVGSKPLRIAYVALLAGIALAVLVAGHLGGSITFGEGFLLGP